MKFSVRSDGDAPKVNLKMERNTAIILTNRNLINACIDLSDGGLALAAFELAHHSNVGLEIYETPNFYSKIKLDTF